MTGFLIYIATLAYVPHLFFVIVFFYVLWKSRADIYQTIKKFENKEPVYISKNLIIIVLIVFLSLLNSLFGMASHQEAWKPYFLLLFVSVFIGMKIKPEDYKVLIWLIALESLVGVAEFAMHTNTFFPGLKESSFGREGLMYYKRVFGLSSNSSVFAYKLLLAFMFTDLLELKSLKYSVLRLVYLVGIFVSFNRTVLLALTFYIGLRIALFVIEFYFNLQMRQRESLWRFVKLFFIGLGIAATVVLVIAELQVLINQFTRDSGKVDLSGRQIIWTQFADFIKNHFWFGNNSYKFFGVYGGKPAHAHDAYMQVLATNGIFIAVLYYLLLILNIRKDNAIYMLTLMIYSITQYGIFWGISLADIFLYTLIFQKIDNFLTKEDEKNINGNRSASAIYQGGGSKS